MPPASDNFHVTKDRIEALSDGVFAIALTLLVLELKIPELARTEAIEHFNEHLALLQPLFFGYVVTFLTGGLFWFLQCVSLRLINQMTPVLVTLNLIFLGFVSLLPFTMSLWSRFQDLATPNVFYFGNFLGISATLSLSWFVAQRQGLTSSAASTHDIRRLNRRIFTMPLASVIGLTVAIFFPARAIFVFAAIIVLFRVGGIAIDRRSSD